MKKIAIIGAGEAAMPYILAAKRKNEKILAKNGKKNGEIVGNKMIAIFFFTIYN